MEAKKRKALKDIVDALPSQGNNVWMINAAIIISTFCHAAQKDKNEHPYILHPLRVGLKCKDGTAMIAAFLHDVVEDTDCTLEDLEYFGFDAPVVNVVTLLTKKDGEPYEPYIERIAENVYAREAKANDIKDNSDPDRNLFPYSEETRRRIRKYNRALDYLAYKIWE